MTDQESSGRQSNALGVAGVLFAGIVWGTTGTAATFTPDVSAAAIGAAAMGIGGIGQALLALRGISHARAQLWQQRGLLQLGALAVMIYPLAFYGSMRLAGVTIGTVVTIGTASVYFKGGKPKNSNRFTPPSGMFVIDQVAIDEGSKAHQSRVSMPITEPSNGAIIGVITVELEAAAFF